MRMRTPRDVHDERVVDTGVAHVLRRREQQRTADVDFEPRWSVRQGKAEREEPVAERAGSAVLRRAEVETRPGEPTLEAAGRQRMSQQRARRPRPVGRQWPRLLPTYEGCEVRGRAAVIEHACRSGVGTRGETVVHLEAAGFRALDQQAGDELRSAE